MSYNVHFDLGERKKCLTVSVSDPAEAVRITKAIYPEAKNLKAESAVTPPARPLPLVEPPPQVKEAEKPRKVE